MAAPATLDENIKAYEACQAEMERRHMHKYVVFYDREFIGVFDDFSGAAHEAVRRYGRGPYLIREVGAGPVKLSSSVMYRPVGNA